MVLVCYCLCESCHGIAGKVRLTSWSEASLAWDAVAGSGVIHVYITLKCLYKPFCVITEGFMGHSVLWKLQEEALVMSETRTNVEIGSLK